LLLPGDGATFFARPILVAVIVSLGSIAGAAR